MLLQSRHEEFEEKRRRQLQEEEEAARRAAEFKVGAAPATYSAVLLAGLIPNVDSM
jgi:hypothetical protein